MKNKKSAKLKVITILFSVDKETTREGINMHKELIPKTEMCIIKKLIKEIILYKIF